MSRHYPRSACTGTRLLTNWKTGQEVLGVCGARAVRKGICPYCGAKRS